MALTGWPTEASEGQVATELRWRKMARLWAPEGVAAGVLNELAPTLDAGQVTIATGAAWIDGHYAENDTPAAIPVTSDGLVVLRYTYAGSVFAFAFKAGSTTVTQDATTYEIALAQMTGGVLTDRRILVPGSGSGFREGAPVYFTTPGATTFDKAAYPGAVAFRVECQGGGGAGGGATTTTAGAVSAGSGGAGGAYVQSIVPATDLDTSEAVTVGAGGTAAAGADGGIGGDSVFDTIPAEIRAKGGPGGLLGASATPPILVVGGESAGASGSVGQLIIGGGDGGQALYLNSATSRGGGMGGGSHLAGARGANNTNAGPGQAGRTYGGGGSGATNGASQGTARVGGVGGAGIVIITPLY